MPYQGCHTKAVAGVAHCTDNKSGCLHPCTAQCAPRALSHATNTPCLVTTPHAPVAVRHTASKHEHQPLRPDGTQWQHRCSVICSVMVDLQALS